MILTLCRRYAFFLGLALLSASLLFLAPATGQKALELTRANLVEMLSFLPPIFVLLGLLDVWVERETMMKYLGEGSGLRGMLLAFFLGSAAAGPLYAAFPLACVMMQKGARMLNVFIFIGAWSCTKIPLIMFETATLGFRFMALRLAFNIAGIFLIALVLDRSLRAR
ncbi:permease [Mailhella massiliensis]|uniref:Permease n=1 Tax=Mailhella massiliensis TaxID=1903261 RepID=A0A921AWU4_9BACT|nr:permease [Mailhella massiliensis]HJD97785.1 permease [Mailhella massiliensis]